MIAPIAKKLLLSGSLYTTFKLSRTFSKINGRSLTAASFSAKSEATCRATIRWCSYSTFSTPFQALSWVLPPPRRCGRILAEKGGDFMNARLIQDLNRFFSVFHNNTLTDLHKILPSVPAAKQYQVELESELELLRTSVLNRLKEELN